jgi:hypothetical protein
LNGRRVLVENCSWVPVRLATEVADARGAADQVSVGARSVAPAKVKRFALPVRVRVRSRLNGGKRKDLVSCGHVFWRVNDE